MSYSTVNFSSQKVGRFELLIQECHSPFNCMNSSYSNPLEIGPNPRYFWVLTSQSLLFLIPETAFDNTETENREQFASFFAAFDVRLHRTLYLYPKTSPTLSLSITPISSPPPFCVSITNNLGIFCIKKGKDVMIHSIPLEFDSRMLLEMCFDRNRYTIYWIIVWPLHRRHRGESRFPTRQNCRIP